MIIGNIRSMLNGPLNTSGSLKELSNEWERLPFIEQENYLQYVLSSLEHKGIKLKLILTTNDGLELNISPETIFAARKQMQESAYLQRVYNDRELDEALHAFLLEELLVSDLNTCKSRLEGHVNNVLYNGGRGIGLDSFYIDLIQNPGDISYFDSSNRGLVTVKMKDLSTYRVSNVKPCPIRPASGLIHDTVATYLPKVFRLTWSTDEGQPYPFSRPLKIHTNEYIVFGERQGFEEESIYLSPSINKIETKVVRTHTEGWINATSGEEYYKKYADNNLNILSTNLQDQLVNRNIYTVHLNDMAAKREFNRVKCESDLYTSNIVNCNVDITLH